MRRKLFSIILAVITVFTCMMFTACKEEKKTTKYTVSFDSMGGSAVLSQQIEKNKTAAQPIDPTREGYVFIHWYLNDESVEFDFVNHKINNDIVLKAYWRSEDQPCIITYKFVDGTVYTTQEVERNDYATRPQDPIKVNRTFVYWYEEEGDGPFDFSATKIRNDITLYANMYIGTVNEGQIKFFLDEGSSINVSGLPAGGSVMAQSGQTVQLPILTAQLADEFLGWVNATTGEKYLVEDYPNSADYKFVYDGRALLMYALWDLVPQVIV